MAPRHSYVLLTCALGALVILPAVAHAQADPGAWQAAALVAVADSGAFDEADTGVGVRAGWSTSSRVLGIEAEVTYYPADFTETNSFSSSRLEGFFGGTFGPQLGRLRPFARLRPGFLRYADAPGPIACIAIFPPPLACELAQGATLPALDIGGGVAFDVSERGVIRLDVGSRVVRYDGPVHHRGNVRDETFWSAGVRFAASVGLRF